MTTESSDNPPDRPSRRSRWVVPSVCVAVSVVVLVAVLALTCTHRIVDGAAIKSRAERWKSTSGAPEVHDGKPGPLGGPTYDPGQRVNHIAWKLTVPFEFDLPGGWACRHVKDAPLDKRMTCMDETRDGGAAGWIGVKKCVAPCGKTEQDAVRALLAVDAGGWKPIDANTSYARVSGTLGNDRPVVRIAMTHAFALDSGDPDTVAVVLLTGPPDTTDTMQKIANEILVRSSA